MPEGDQKIAALFIAIDGRAVDHHDIEFAVVVAIEQANAAAHGLDNVIFFARRNMRGGQAGLGGDVAKDRNGCRNLGYRNLLLNMNIFRRTFCAKFCRLSQERASKSNQ